MNKGKILLKRIGKIGKWKSNAARNLKGRQAVTPFCLSSWINAGIYAFISLSTKEILDVAACTITLIASIFSKYRIISNFHPSNRTKLYF